MKNSNVIYEQIDEWEKLPDIDQAISPVQRKKKYPNDEIKQISGVWYKKAKTPQQILGTSGSSETTETSGSLYKKVNFTGEDIMNNNVLIKKYMRGNIVKKIQNYLKQLGFNKVSKSGRSDGDYGDMTKKAVEDYQTSTNGDLVVDGIVGNKTWSRLIKDVTEKEKETSDEVGPEIVKISVDDL